jgi:predicted nuclease of predicted toxin-antitoxin system
MNLLLDHNISHRLIERLADIFPGASHVMLSGLDQATDVEVWEYARTHNFAIVTKDTDFNDLSIVRGLPPKVVWLRVGNCTTTHLERVLRSHAPAIFDFLHDAETGLLEVQ